MDWRDIVYGLLFLFLLFILFAHSPGGGSRHGKDKEKKDLDKKGGHGKDRGKHSGKDSRRK